MTSLGVNQCPLCNGRKEIHQNEWGVGCEGCLNEVQSAKQEAAQIRQNRPTQAGVPRESDDFDSFEGDYVCLKGRRYELTLVKGKRCKHTVMNWLNEGPQKFPFCPSCGKQVIKSERAAASDEGNKIPRPRPTDRLSESPRTQDAEEGMAGLHGSDEGETVGDRVETPGEGCGTDEAPATLVKPAKRKRKPRSSGKKS